MWRVLFAVIAAVAGAACAPPEPEVLSQIWHSYDTPGDCLDTSIDGPEAIPRRCESWTPRTHKVSYRAPDGRCWIGPPTTCDLPDGWALAAKDEPCGEDEWILSGVCCETWPPM